MQIGSNGWYDLLILSGAVIRYKYLLWSGIELRIDGAIASTDAYALNSHRIGSSQI